MEEGKSESKHTNEWECKFCQHYMCRILWSYIALCAIAVGGYFVLVSWLGVSDSDSTTKAAIAIGLLAWTAAMIIPLAAWFAVTDWREQQKLINHAEYAKKLTGKLGEYSKELTSIYVNFNNTLALSKVIKFDIYSEYWNETNKQAQAAIITLLNDSYSELKFTSATICGILDDSNVQDAINNYLNFSGKALGDLLLVSYQKCPELIEVAALEVKVSCIGDESETKLNRILDLLSQYVNFEN